MIVIGKKSGFVGFGARLPGSEPLFLPLLIVLELFTRPLCALIFSSIT